MNVPSYVLCYLWYYSISLIVVCTLCSLCPWRGYFIERYSLEFLGMLITNSDHGVKLIKTIMLLTLDSKSFDFFPLIIVSDLFLFRCLHQIPIKVIIPMPQIIPILPCPYQSIPMTLHDLSCISLKNLHDNETQVVFDAHCRWSATASLYLLISLGVVAATILLVCALIPSSWATFC